MGCNHQPKHVINDDPQVIQARECEDFTIFQENITLPSFCDKKTDLHISNGNSILSAVTAFAKKHNLNLIINTDLKDSCSITYQATNKSIGNILSDLCSLCNWKLTFTADAVIIEADKSYIFMHKLNVLNTKAESSVKTGVNDYYKNDKIMNIGSSISLNTNSNNHIWQEIESYLKFLSLTNAQINNNVNVNTEKISTSASKNKTELAMKKQNAIQSQQIKQLALQQQILLNNVSMTKEIGEPNNLEAYNQVDTPIDTNTKESKDNLSSLNEDDTNNDIHSETDSNDINQSSMQISSEDAISYSINKQAGFIVLKAPQKIHKELAKYIHQLEKKMTAQIKLEARIIEVNLKDEYNMGINWNTLAGQKGNSFNLDTSSASGNFIKFAVGTSGDQIQGFINAMQDYGHTQTISKPELTILHNEIGLFKVVENIVYFKIKILEVLRANAQSYFTYNSDANVLPVGFSMLIQPSIDSDTGDILLHIRPTITAVHHTVEDPSIALNADRNNAAKNIKSEYPVVTSREFDTKLRLKAGQWALLGGHITKTQMQNDKGFPGVKSALGSLFGTKSGGSKNSEIVCILRAYPEKCNIKSLEQRLLEITVA